MTEDFNPAANPAEDTQAPADESQDTAQPPQPDQDEAPAKPKTKAELEEENAKLKEALNHLLLEIDRLKSENTNLRKALPANISAKPGHKVVFIKSNNVAAIPRNGRKYLQGSVNGEQFEVPCDVQVEVRDDIAEALKGVISAQS